MAGVDVQYTSVTTWRRSARHGTSVTVFAASRVCSHLIHNNPASYEQDWSTAVLTITGHRRKYIQSSGVPRTQKVGTLWGRATIKVRGGEGQLFTVDDVLLIVRHCCSSWCILSSGVARICCEEGQRWKLCHGAVTVDFRAGCSSWSMTNSFVTNAVLIERAVSCWHLHQLLSQTTQYFDSWLSDLLQSELKMKLLEVERGTCPSVP